MGADDRPTDDLASMEPAALVEHLLKRYHAPLREALRRLEPLAREAERRHGEDPDYPRGLAGRVEVAAIDLIDHLEREERVLFPAIRRGLTVELTPPVRVMRREHDDHRETFDDLRRRTGIYQVPPGRSEEDAPTWHALYRALSELDAAVHAELRIETDLLFARLVGE